MRKFVAPRQRVVRGPSSDGTRATGGGQGSPGASGSVEWAGRIGAIPRRLKVALLSFHLGEYCVSLANALAAHEDVILFLPRSELEYASSPVSPDVQLEAFDHPRLRQAGRQIHLCRRIVRDLDKIAPDIVHLQQGHVWMSMFAPALRRRRPLVITVHDPVHHTGDKMSRKTPQPVVHFGFRRATCLIVHGAALRNVLMTSLSIPAERIWVIPHHVSGLDAALTDGPVPVPTVLFFGRIWPYKGLEYLIRAQPAISERVPATRFVIAGTGEDLDRYRAMMGDPERFVVHDEYVSNETRAELFREASVVVLPYVDATQSGVIPLAYAHGRPVVTTDVGGLVDAVDDGVTGLVVPPRDEQALADAVIRVLEDDHLRSRMGAAARRKAEREISTEKVAELTAAVYREGIATWAASGRKTRLHSGDRRVR